MTGRSRTCIVNERAGQLCNRAWNANDPHYTLRCIGFQYGRLPTEKKYEYAKVFLLFPLELFYGAPQIRCDLDACAE